MPASSTSPGETAEAIRDQLLPLAAIATPNLFELQWLTGTSVTDRDDIARAHATRPAPHVVTSALPTLGNITTLLAATEGFFERFRAVA